MRVARSLALIGLLASTSVLPVHAAGLLSVGGDGDALINIDPNDNSGSGSGGVSVNLGGGDSGSSGVSVGAGAGGGVSVGSDGVSAGAGAGAGVGVGSGDNSIGVGAGAGAGVALGSDGVDVGAGVGALLNTSVLNHTSLIGVGVRGGVSVRIDAPTGGQPTSGPTTGGLPGIPGNPRIRIPVRTPGVLDGAATNTVASNVAAGGGGTGATGEANCDEATIGEMSTMMHETHVSASWASAATVQVEHLDVCSELGDWVHNQLQADGLEKPLLAAVEQDADISSVLSKTDYSPDEVFAVHQVGNRLVVFVY